MDAIEDATRMLMLAMLIRVRTMAILVPMCRDRRVLLLEHVRVYWLGRVGRACWTMPLRGRVSNDGIQSLQALRTKTCQ